MRHGEPFAYPEAEQSTTLRSDFKLIAVPIGTIPKICVNVIEKKKEKRKKEMLVYTDNVLCIFYFLENKNKKKQKKCEY